MKKSKGNKSSFKILVGVLLLVCFSWALGASGEHENEMAPKNNSKKTPGRVVDGRGSDEFDENCGVLPGDISKFANGESYNFGSVVELVTKPACMAARQSIVSNEIAQGINFNRIPFHLDELAKGYSALTIDGKQRVENGIYKNMESRLRSQAFSDKELLPVLGQLALLSPKAARSTLAYLTTQELISQELQEKGKLVEGRDLTSAVDTISTLKKFGVNEPLILAELSANVEEMAATSQADSLGKVLTGLALAAKDFEGFSGVFNETAGAFNRGVKKTAVQYSKEEKGNLLKAGFLAAKATVGAGPSLEPGIEEINQALGRLFAGEPLAETTLRSVWRKVLDVTAASPFHTALAQALALSLTSEVIFLSKPDREKVIESSKNYPALAQTVQQLYLTAWSETRSKVLAGKMKTSVFNDKKEKFFEPWISQILDCELEALYPPWIEEMVGRGMIKDEDIQFKFPRFVLALIEKHELEAKAVILNSSAEAIVGSALTHFAMLSDLSNIYLPALEDWSKRHENDAASD